MKKTFMLFLVVMGCAGMVMAADFTAIFDSSNGSSGYSWQDSGAMEVGRIDSDGNLSIRGGLRLDTTGIKCTTAEMMIIDGKLGIGIVNPMELLEVGGGIRIGNSTGSANGIIRWTGTDFEGHKAGSWTSLTKTPYILLAQRVGGGGEGGTATAGAWEVQSVNAELSDEHSICTVVPPYFTLLPGTYRFSITAPAYCVGRHQAKLQNITDATVALLGSAELSPQTNGSQTSSIIRGQVTIPASKSFQVMHSVEFTKSANGYGVSMNFGEGSDFLVVEIWKIN
ncbi:MAG: hypothetical protein PHQ23_05860 [Candidatus Wallbacteria bacterium]|nr:hypothetical protein [Candidatus Wallbacteria bacterium]